jgi:hypothetical protein
MVELPPNPLDRVLQMPHDTVGQPTRKVQLSQREALPRDPAHLRRHAEGLRRRVEEHVLILLGGREKVLDVLLLLSGVTLIACEALEGSSY